MEGGHSKSGYLGRWSKALLRRLRQRNVLLAVRSNVAHHHWYALFEAFLDQDLQYSCALFAAPRTSLDDAQLAKKASAWQLNGVTLLTTLVDAHWYGLRCWHVAAFRVMP